eukprot:1180621-Prorocentrum_minimum.AAC.1
MTLVYTHTPVAQVRVQATRRLPSLGVSCEHIRTHRSFFLKGAVYEGSSAPGARNSAGLKTRALRLVQPSFRPLFRGCVRLPAAEGGCGHGPGPVGAPTWRERPAWRPHHTRGPPPCRAGGRTADGSAGTPAPAAPRPSPCIRASRSCAPAPPHASRQILDGRLSRPPSRLFARVDVLGPWRGVGGGSEGIYRSSLDASEPQNPTKSEEYQRHLQGVLYSA